MAASTNLATVSAMRALKFLAGLFAVVFALTGCSSGSSTVEDGATLTVEAFASAMTEPGTVLIDVRTPAEYAAGHIDGALLIDIASPEFATQIGKLDKSKKYALYCRSDNRSGQAMKLMRDSGFGFVYHLGGGIGAWQAAGKPLVR